MHRIGSTVSAEVHSGSKNLLLGCRGKVLEFVVGVSVDCGVTRLPIGVADEAALALALDGAVRQASGNTLIRKRYAASVIVCVLTQEHQLN